VIQITFHFFPEAYFVFRAGFRVPVTGAGRTMQSPVRNTLLLGVLLGLVIGLGGYTFIYSKGYSYLTNNPAAARIVISCAPSTMPG
jgi:hypothetical protein